MHSFSLLAEHGPRAVSGRPHRLMGTGTPGGRQMGTSHSKPEEGQHLRAELGPAGVQGRFCQKRQLARLKHGTQPGKEDGGTFSARCARSLACQRVLSKSVWVLLQAEPSLPPLTDASVPGTRGTHSPQAHGAHTEGADSEPSRVPPPHTTRQVTSVFW